MFTRMDHVALHVADVPAAADFYVNVLGFEKVYDSPGTGGSPIVYVRLGTSMIELTTRPSGEPMSGFHFGMETADLATTMDTLKAHGLAVVTEPKPATPRGDRQKGWKRAVLRGPHGELIEIKGP